MKSFFFTATNEQSVSHVLLVLFISSLATRKSLECGAPPANECATAGWRIKRRYVLRRRERGEGISRTLIVVRKTGPDSRDLLENNHHLATELRLLWTADPNGDAASGIHHRSAKSALENFVRSSFVTCRLKPELVKDLGRSGVACASA